MTAALLTGLYRGWIRKRKPMLHFLRRLIDAEELTVVKKLGEAAFSEVWPADYRPFSDGPQEPGRSTSVAEVALKMRKSDELNYELTLISAECFFQEAAALNFLSHPNIITANDLCTNIRNKLDILVLEYMNGGDCRRYIKTERGHLMNADLTRICRNVIQACLHLTKMGFVHRDIGAQNVLVRKSEQTSEPEVAKLTDFGLSIQTERRDTGYTSVDGEALFYARGTAPEGFEGRFSYQSDVRSFGVFVWELYSLVVSNTATPYQRLRTKEAILDYLNGGNVLEMPQVAPAEVYFLMSQCWATDPFYRPTFKQLNVSWKLIGNDKEKDQKPLILALPAAQIVAVQQSNADAGGEEENVPVELFRGNPNSERVGYVCVPYPVITITLRGIKLALVFRKWSSVADASVGCFFAYLYSMYVQLPS